MQNYTLNLPPVYTGIDAKTGRFMKGHIPANKGRKWSEYLPKRMQKRCAKGWKNLEIHRNKNGRPDTAGRCRKQVIGILPDGKFKVFTYIGAAAEWCNGNRFNLGRCCRQNHSGTRGRKGEVNTDHMYLGIRWYFEKDIVWIKKIAKS